jgi:hypothetical protein
MAVPPKPPPRPKKHSKPPRPASHTTASHTTEIDVAWAEPTANESAKSRAKTSVPARSEPGQRRDTIPVQPEWLEFVEDAPEGIILSVPNVPPLPRHVPRPRRKAAPPPLPPAVDEKPSKHRSSRPKKTTTHAKTKKP